MTKGKEIPINSRMSTADIAYGILKSKGEPVYFRNLIEEVLAVRNIQADDLGHQMAAVHTELNLDNRFVFLGKGTWSLREFDLADRHKQNEEDWDA